MTREQKLALIVGFALVLVVGVLISDQLSVARRPVDSTAGGLAASLEPTGSEVYPGFGRALETRPEPVIPIADQRQFVEFETGLGGDLPAEQAQTTTLADNAIQTLSDGIATVGGLIVDGQNNGIAAMQTHNVPTLDMGEQPVAEEQKPAWTDPREQAPATEASRTEPKQEVRPVRTHRVGEGDTLWSIAKRYYGDGSAADALAKYNEKRVGKGGVIREGASLLIPDREELGLSGPAKVADATPAKAKKTEASTKSEPKQTEPKKADAKKAKPEAGKTYTVKSGDTLQKISEKFFGTTKRWHDIAELNASAIDDVDNLKVGTVIKIPAR